MSGRRQRRQPPVAEKRRAPTAQRLHLEMLEPRCVPSAGSSVAAAYEQLPLSFEPNVGQFAAAGRFFSPGVGYSLLLEDNQALLALENPSGQAGVTLTTRFVGANPDARMTALEPQPGVSNYLLGSDPGQWHTNIQHYAAVKYQGLYRHIDLVYHGTGEQLEYDFVVNPGGQPGAIRMAIDGAQSMSLDSQGGLVIETAAGTMVEQAPVVYQQLPNGRIRSVRGRFVLLNGDQVAFAVGAYDARLPLIIDPSLRYSSYLGSSGYDQGNAIALDSSGNAYVTGSTTSTINIGSPIQPLNGGGTDAFVVKMNAAGNSLIYYTYIGGSGYDSGLGIAADSSGDAWVTGITTSTNFPTKGALQTSSAGSSDAFVARINSTGTLLLDSSYLGGSGSDEGLGIALDSAANAYITGATSSTNFPTKNALQSASGGGTSDAFVTEVQANLTSLSIVYSSYLGGSGYDAGNAIAVDSNANIYVAGTTSSTDFPVKNAIKATNAGSMDAFVAKINHGETSVAYATYLGGTSDDGASGIAVDSSGNAYVAGFTMSTNFPTLGAYQSTNKGSIDAFAAKINAAGSALVYSTYVGGTSDDYALAIAVDSSGNAYIAGSTASTNFPTLSAVQTSSQASSGAENAFLTKLNSTGSALVYSTYLGGNGSDGDFAAGVVVDSNNFAYVTGFSSSTSFPLANAYQGTFGGGLADAFILKIG